jgi:hypothetical protein
VKKNHADGISSTAYVPLRDIVAFVPVMNETIKPYLESKGNTEDEMAGMHLAWCKSVQMKIGLWSRLYLDVAKTSNEW